MDFSILICTKNRSVSVVRTLRHVSQLDFPGSFEIVVADNGSTDDTPAAVQRESQALRRPVRYLRCDQPGKSNALNAGIAAARGDIVAFTDDDALPAADWLTAIAVAIEANNADWVYGPVRPRWETERPAWYSKDTDGMFALLDLGPVEFVATEGSEPFFGVNCAAKRSALRAVGNYRPDLGPTALNGGGGEDSEMFLRAIGRGQCVVYSPAVRVEHVIPAERTTRAFHLRRFWAGRVNNYKLLQLGSITGPRWLGIPRYYFSLAIADVARLPGDVVFGRHGRAVMRQIHLVRFAGLVQQGILRMFGHQPHSVATAVTAPSRSKEAHR